MAIPNRQHAYDLFISYAHDDAAEFAGQLTALLRQYGVRIWLDSHECSLGDRLANRIAHGISNSQLAVVIASPAYLVKGWTTEELNTLISHEIGGRITILPILHQLELSQLQAQNPLLGARLLFDSSKDLHFISAAIITRVLHGRTPTRPTIETYQAVFTVTPSPTAGCYSQTLHVNGVFRVPPGAAMLYEDKVTGSSPDGNITGFRSVPERYAEIDEQQKREGLNMPFEIHGRPGSTTMQISATLELTKRMCADDGYVAFSLPYDTRHVSIIFDYSGLEFEPTEFLSHVDSQSSESRRRAVAPILTHWPERKTLVAHGEDLPKGSHPMIGWGRWVAEWRR